VVKILTAYNSLPHNTFLYAVFAAFTAGARMFRVKCKLRRTAHETKIKFFFLNKLHE
jgi:hypothetical protein